ncbi:FUSC family protein [Parasulfuritortus cantonensis]|uniref:FUSC family protein n=1 Tax=Parasulfuritortus cantonensis TaxID=2528202 RepID=A0A4R1BLX2_9PROT|nr:FUSC family protein [Parasulfuritortus cantonensis]TCJ18394.1 FUSC family protein [Parasulfuritortus cantonensis]
MSAAVLPAPLAGAWRRVAARFRLWQRAPGWTSAVHVFKVVLAAELALVISLAGNLESPRTAMFCVYLVMQVRTGLVFQKSYYRLLGTLAGAAASVILIGGFAQTPELFWLYFGLWMAAATAGSFVYRNFQSYGFVLAGYTVCFVALPAIDNPAAVFDIATTRMLEMLVGVLCAALVSDTVFPLRMAGLVRGAVSRRFTDFCAVLAESPAKLRAGDTGKATMLRFAGDAVGLEAASANAALESSDLRRQRLRLQLLNHEFMGVTSILHAYHQMLRRLQATGHPAVTEALMGLYGGFSALFAVAPQSAPAAGRLLPALGRWRDDYGRRAADCRARLPATLDAAQRLDFETGIELLQRLAEEFAAYCATQAALDEGADDLARGGRLADEETLRFSTRTDPLLAGLGALRGVLVMVVTAGFWTATAWPSGTGAITNGVASGTVFATLPAPARVLRQAMLGSLLALPIGLLWNFQLIPLADDWVGLGLILIPPLALAAWLASTPRWAGVGAGLYISFMLHSSLERSFSADLPTFVDACLADFVGLVVAITFYQLLDPNAGPWSRRRIVGALRRQMVAACLDPVPPRREVLESASRDLVQRIATQGKLADEIDHWVFDWQLTVLETGRAVLDLRAVMAGSPAEALPLSLSLALQRLGELFEAPARARRRVAAEAVESAIVALDGADAALTAAARRALVLDLHFIRSALLDAVSVLDGPAGGGR